MKKALWIVLIVLVAARLLAPPLILKKLNQFLAEVSPAYQIHIADLDLGILRGAYQFEGVTGTLKKSNEVFLKADKLDISLAWRELFKGRVLTDAVGEGINFVYTPELIDALKATKTKEDAGKVQGKLFPFRIARVDLRNSSFQYADLPSLPEVERWQVTGIEGRLSNVIATEKNPMSLFTARGTLLGSSTLKAVGQIDTLTKPLRWDVDLAVQEFDLVKANPLLKRKVPVTFTAGKLDLYGEIKSENGDIEGYVKPFLKKVDVVENSEHFLGLKHFGVEITTAAVNLILRRAKDDVVATKVLFAYNDGKFQVNSMKAISEAIKNGFSEKLNPGVEDLYTLAPPKITKKDP